MKISSALITYLSIILSPIATSATISNYTNNFNTSSDFTGSFYTTGSQQGTWNATGGINGAGGVTYPTTSDSLSTLTTQAFTLSPGTTSTITAFYQNAGNSGYGGMGFAAASNNTPFAYFPQASNAIGVIFHSGGGFWANNTSSASDTSLTWPNGGIPTNSGSWYELVLTIAALGSNNFNQTFTVYNANSSGVVGSQIFNVSTSLSNSIIGGASQVYFYMGAEQTRVGAFDNIQIQAVQSTVPEPSTYALFGLGAVGMLLVMRRKID